MFDTPETAETRVFLESLHREVFRPNAERLAEIIHGGGVAALVHNLGEVGKLSAETFGWDGHSPCWKLSKRALWIAEHSWRDFGDTVAADWIGSNRPGRVLVITGDGSLCVNVNATDGGISVEPGTLDAEWAREALS